jgi:hypothetical protein
MNIKLHVPHTGKNPMAVSGVLPKKRAAHRPLQNKNPQNPQWLLQHELDSLIAEQYRILSINVNDYQKIAEIRQSIERIREGII